MTLFTARSATLLHETCLLTQLSFKLLSYLAAYIWLDLNQKDIKARLSALKKSQKDASILAERSSRIMTSEKQGAENITRASELEYHLMQQWRSLFQHMSNIWEAESNQLEASLLPLNNLKDKCKAELELINAKLPDIDLDGTKLKELHKKKHKYKGKEDSIKEDRTSVSHLVKH